MVLVRCRRQQRAWTRVENSPVIFGEEGTIIGYFLGIDQPKSGVHGGNVAIVGWWQALANQMASTGVVAVSDIDMYPISATKTPYICYFSDVSPHGGMGPFLCCGGW